jgi:diguanylate cyclase (GGDEF)-like protein
VALVGLLMTLGAVVLAEAVALAMGAEPNLLVAVVGIACATAALPLVAWALGLAVKLDNARVHLAHFAGDDESPPAPERHRFLELTGREWARCRRYGEDAALLLIAVDRLRSLRAELGLNCADAMLAHTTQLAVTTLREPDLLARFGGDEIAAFLPHTDPMGALDAAERIRERVALLPHDWQGHDVSSTVSIGVASVGASHNTLEALIHEADIALLAAKQAGRNCVRAAPIPPRHSGENRPVAQR